MSLFSRLKADVHPVPLTPLLSDEDYGQARCSASGKQFHAELSYFTRRIENQENFSLVRFGDGEMMIIEGQGIDLSAKYNGEHKYVPGDTQQEQQRSLLAQSLAHKQDDYFVGIACPCCVGQSSFDHLKQAAGQREEQLTWANVFVNSNYKAFQSSTVPALARRKVNIVCHEKANTDNLPFEINKRFSVGPNSWVNDYQRLRQEMLAYIQSSNSQSEVFLFCAGVLSNIIIFELAGQAPEHTYIDVGSVFDVQLQLGQTRKYLKNGKTLKKVCVWN